MGGDVSLFHLCEYSGSSLACLRCVCRKRRRLASEQTLFLHFYCESLLTLFARLHSPSLHHLLLGLCSDGSFSFSALLLPRCAMIYCCASNWWERERLQTAELP